MKEKYSNVTTKILFCIPLLFILFITDFYLLPKKIINDKIIGYSQIVIKHRNKFSTSSSKESVGNIFFTEKGYQFSMRDTFIEEQEITIGQSYIFQNINTIYSQKRDYSEKLMSGLNGASFFFIVGLVITAIISLLLLKFNKNLSENGFQNILLINSFLLFIALYVFSIYN